MPAHEPPGRTTSLDAGSRARILTRVRAALDRTADYVANTANYEHSEDLWPADSEIFTTNPMSLAYGACGPALFLNCTSAPAGLPDQAVKWILDSPIGTDSYPPGVCLGLAGIAVTLMDLRMPERALEAMGLAYRSPLAFEETNFFYGCAGWGTASLHLHQATGERAMLDGALRAGEHLLKAAHREGETCHWGPNAQGSIPYGFGYGASGCALFLLHLHSVTGDTQFRDAAVRALSYDLEHGTVGPLGWQWQDYEGGALIKPYWMSGAAGVGSTLLRFHRALGDDRFLIDARRIARDTSVKFTVEPGLFQGLAGIAEFFLDMYVHTGEGIFRDHALDIADTIMWFGIRRQEGTAWPGRRLRKISNDYATGAAGIGLFFDRLLQPRARFLLDLPLHYSPPTHRRAG
ncbi:lanthionine synthetase C family protein [Streptomyces sp. NPDC056347]|uniref:lanthionine synthetase C family protein n=1 Tax=Streptomyces sp. NPDC056347 TaxID=3345790 RepID=UPI0035D8D99D